MLFRGGGEGTLAALRCARRTARSAGQQAPVLPSLAVLHRLLCSQTTVGSQARGCASPCLAPQCGSASRCTASPATVACHDLPYARPTPARLPYARCSRRCASRPATAPGWPPPPWRSWFRRAPRTGRRATARLRRHRASWPATPAQVRARQPCTREAGSGARWTSRAGFAPPPHAPSWAATRLGRRRRRGCGRSRSKTRPRACMPKAVSCAPSPAGLFPALWPAQDKLVVGLGRVRELRAVTPTEVKAAGRGCRAARPGPARARMRSGSVCALLGALLTEGQRQSLSAGRSVGHACADAFAAPLSRCQPRRRPDVAASNPCPRVWFLSSPPRSLTSLSGRL